MISKEKDFSWDLYSLAICAVFLFFQIAQWPLFPKFLDVYYHLAVMKGFETAGGYVTHAFWEYAPFGRPHLYPPVLHLLMLDLYKLGVPEMTIARLLDCLLYPVTLFALWMVCKNWYGSRPAFFVLLVYASVYSLYLACVTLAPFTLAFIAGLFMLLSLERGKVIAAGVLLAIGFYTHTLMAFLFLATILFYGLLERRRLVAVCQAASLALGIAAPLLLFQFGHRYDFQFLNIRENHSLELDLFVYGLALCGLWLAFQRKGKYWLPVSLAAAMFFLIPTHRFRFFSGHGLVGFVLLAGLALDFFYEGLASRFKKRSFQALFIVGCFVIFYFLAPVFQVDLKAKSVTTRFFDRSLTQYLKNQDTRNFRAKGFSIYFPKEYGEIAEVIEKHSSSDDIIWTDFNYAGGILSILTGRATSSAMLPEVKPDPGFDALASAKILLWFKDENGLAPAGMEETVLSRHLKYLQETTFAFIYENPADYSTRQSKKAVVSLTLANILLGAGIFIVILGNLLAGDQASLNIKT